MGIFDGLFGAKKTETINRKPRASSPKDEKEFTLQVVPFQKLEKPATKESKYLDAYKEWLYPNINVIAEAVANIEFELYRVKKDDDAEEIKQHEVLELLYGVNDFQTKYDLIFTTVTHLMLMGESVWYLVGRENNLNAKPTEIWNLRPDLIEIEVGNLEQNEFIKRYIYKVPGKKPVYFKPQEIIFFRNNNPSNPYRGMGIVEASAITLDTDIFASMWNRNFFQNSAQPSAVLMTDAKLGKDEADRLLQTWNSKFKGVDNANKLAILSHGLTYQSIQASAKDMDFLEQQKWTRDKIMAMFRNTKVALGITEDVNRANAEASEYVHAKNVIKPKMQRLCDILNEFLVPLYGKDIFLSFKDPVPEDEAVELKELEILTNKVYTINEAREVKGLEPLEGGDAIYMPFTQAPMGEKPEPNKPQQEEGKVLKLKKTKQNKIINKKFSEEIRKLKNRNVKLEKATKLFENKLKEIIKDSLKKNKKVKKAVKKKSEELPERKEMYWRGFVRRSDKWEKLMKGELVERVYPRWAREAKKELRKKKVLNEEFGVSTGLVFMTPIITDMMIDMGNEALSYLGIHTAYEPVSSRAIGYISNNTSKWLKSHAGTFRDIIKRTLEEGIKNGEGIGKLSRRIDDVFAERYMAERLVRTETIKAMNFSATDAWQESGIVTGQEWVTAFDERTCGDCEEMDGKIVALEDDYLEKGDKLPSSGREVDYEDIGFPPLHSACRCTTIPVLKEWKGLKPDKDKTLDEALDRLTKELGDDNG